MIVYFISVAVKLDLFVSSEPALYEVCKALKVSGFRESTLRLIVDKLDVTCLGQPKVAILLEQINPEVTFFFTVLDCQTLLKNYPLLLCYRYFFTIIYYS
jgi:hypothetical protein